MKLNDAILGVVFLLAGLAIIWGAVGLPGIPGQVGADLFPKLIGAGMVLVSLILIRRGVAAWGATPTVALAAEVSSGKGRAIVGCILLGLVLYVVLLDVIGFLPLTFLYTAVIIRVAGGSTVGAVVYGALVTFAVERVFTQLLAVPLPLGVLPWIGA